MLEAERESAADERAIAEQMRQTAQEYERQLRERKGTSEA